MKLIAMLIAGISAACSIVASAHADYIVTGEIKGQECSSFILFESCKMRPVHAAKDEHGQLFTIGKRYPSVSEYKESSGKCWINIKSRGAGLWSTVMKLFSGVEFYEQLPSGEFSHVDAEYLVFPCRKQ